MNSSTLETLTATMAHWYATEDGENYEVGPEDSREAVIAAATREGLGEPDEGVRRFTIALCTVQLVPMSTTFDFEDFLDRSNERAHDDYTWEGEPDPFFAMTKDQRSDLDARMRAAIDAWQVEHQLTFPASRFLSTRHEEVIEIPVGEADQS